MAHSRKRSGTLSSLIPPPTPLRDGQSTRLTLWISDQNPDRVVLNHDSWPGVVKGDVIQVRKKGDDVQSSLNVFYFVVGKDEGDRYGSLQQITVPKHLATVFGLQNHREVLLTKVDKDSVAADAVEVFFRDQYLGRSDMWRLGESLGEQCIHVEEKITFAGCISATVKSLYVKDKKVSSAYITPSTKIIFRSMSAKVTIFIQVCRELWDFSDDGERYYEKICHYFLPALVDRWLTLGTTHVVTVVLISRVFYEESEKEYASGPLRQDGDSGQWYKDFYKVIVDLEVIHDWKPSLVYLKESFWTFQRDILLTHHYHQNSHTQLNVEAPVRLVGRLCMAHEGPILEAINLSLNPMESHYVDRSLVLTGASMILLTPGTGHFRVNKRMLQLTTNRMLDQGFGLDVVCLSKAPLHRSPIFSFIGIEPGAHESIPGLRDTDPLWVWEEAEGAPAGVRRRGSELSRTQQARKCLYWEPFWVSLSFWDQQTNMPFRSDRFVPRARMYEIQMLGLLAHDVSTLAIPHLEKSEGLEQPLEVTDRKEHSTFSQRKQFDGDVFSFKDAHQPVSLSRGPSTSSSGGLKGISRALPANAMRTISDFRTPPASETVVESDERPALSTASSNSSVATTLAAHYPGAIRGHHNKGSRTPVNERQPLDDISKATPSSASTPVHARSSSPSQASIKSNSTSSTRNSRSKSTRPSNLTSKFGVGQWLLNSFTSRAPPSQAEASQVSVSAMDTTPIVADASIPSKAPDMKNLPYIQSSPPTLTPKPIAIKRTGPAPRRLGMNNRADDTIKATASTSLKSRAYLSPVSSSPAQESAMMVINAKRVNSTSDNAAIPTNPSRGLSALSHSQSALARRWQHTFTQPTLQHQIKWKSMCTPSCLPLTTEYYPSKTELDKAYQTYSYDVLVTPDVHASFMLKRGKGKTEEEEDWPLLVMKQMAALRLALGFQFIVAPSFLVTAEDSSIASWALRSTGAKGPQAMGRYVKPDHPIGASEFFKTSRDSAYLSMSNQIHKISFDPVEQIIQVSRYVRRTTHNTDTVLYGCLVWPRLGDGYREVSAAFSHPNLDMYSWNRYVEVNFVYETTLKFFDPSMDMLVAGYEHDLAESLRYWRTRFLVIPSEQPPTFTQLSGESLTDEEIRLLGADKLAELFHKAKWNKPNEPPEESFPTRFLPTTLDPSTCVLDENLMAQLDKLQEEGHLKKKSNSTRSVEDNPLTTLTKAMREDDGLPMKDHVWHRNIYPDSFTGYEFVSWLVREFKDVATREQASTWGARLMEQGIMEHCRGKHGFLDGHYYYRLRDEYSTTKQGKAPKWFRTASMPVGRSEEAPSSSSVTLETIAAKAGVRSPSPPVGHGPRKPRKLVLSQTMIIDVDPNGKSKYAETAILHHDVIQNPGTAFHFELNWMGTTARFIDDIVQYWSKIIEKYGLRLVEAYVDPIVNIRDKNVFQSTFPVRLAAPPPEVPNLQRRLPEGTRAEFYFEHCILKHFGYILDIEAGSRYSNSVDVCYTYRRSSFKHSQYVHKSGLAFVQVIGGWEGFRWLTNRLAGTSNNYSFHSWTTTSSTAVAGRASANSSVAPPIAPNERAEKERVATSVLIQRQLKGLHEFCSSAERLQAFYNSVLIALPPEPDQE